MPTNQAAAKVTGINGKVYAERNGTRISLTEGAEVFAADSIITDNSGGVELVFRDNAVIKLGPGSQVNVQDFVYDGESNPSFAIELATGVMQSLSGEVVKQNPAAFKITTPRANIGIRGTETYHSVQGDTETHAVIHISEGHIVLLTASDGRSITLASAMQAVSLRGDSHEALTIRSFQPTEMDSLQDALRDLRQPGERGKPEASEGPQGQESAPSTELSGDESAQNPQTLAPSATSTVVQDDILVLVVAEASTENVVTMVQDSLQNLQDSSNILINSPVLTPLDTVPDAGTDALAPNPVVESPLAPAAPEWTPPKTEEPQPEPPPAPVEPGQTYTWGEVNDPFTAGAGNDTISAVTLRPLGSIDAGAGDDSITIAWANGGTVEGGAGSDTLTLGTGGNPNSVTISGIEHVYGSAGTDHITLGSGGNNVTVQGVENIQGGAGNDHITILSGNERDIVKGGGGDDVISITTLKNASTVYGEEGNDHISITTLSGTAAVRGEQGTDTIELKGWESGAKLTVDINAADNDILKLSPGTSEHGGQAVGANWEMNYTSASGQNLTVIFEGINTQAQYDTLKSQIEGLSGTI